MTLSYTAQKNRLRLIQATEKARAERRLREEAERAEKERLRSAVADRAPPDGNPTP